MIQSNNPNDKTLQVLHKLNPMIKMRARQSAPPNEREDVAQELRCAVIEQLPKHNPDRASATGFGAMLADQAWVSELRKRHAAKRVPPSPLIPLDGIAVTAPDPWAAIELKLDLRAAIESPDLDPDSRSFVEAFMLHGSIKAASRHLGIGISTAKRHRDRFREHCKKLGIGPTT